MIPSPKLTVSTSGFGGSTRSPKRLRAEHRNEVWSWDLLYDQTDQGRTLRILTLIDEYTKECLTIHAGYSIRAVDAITVLEAAIQRYGPPQYLRSDNGPEFIAQAIQDRKSTRLNSSHTVISY